jgi:hypothetical protein
MGLEEQSIDWWTLMAREMLDEMRTPLWFWAID